MKATPTVCAMALDLNIMSRYALSYYQNPYGKWADLLLVHNVHRYCINNNMHSGHLYTIL